MFGNMKVGVKLGLGFGLVLVLLGTLLAVGILRLTDIKRDVDVVVNELWPKTQLLQDGLVGVNEIALGGRELVIAENGEQIRRAKDRMLGGRERIGKAWDTLGPMLVQPRGKELFAEVLDSRQRFIPAQNRLIELVEQGRSDEARAYLRGDYDAIAVQYRQRVNALTAYQGELLTGTGSLYPVATDAHWRYEVDFAATNANLAELLSASLGKPVGDLRGTLDGTARIGGYIGRGQGPTVTGAGQAVVRGGLLFQTRLFSGLSAILSKVIPDVSLFAQTDAKS